LGTEKEKKVFSRTFLKNLEEGKGGREKGSVTIQEGG